MDFVNTSMKYAAIESKYLESSGLLKNEKGNVILYVRGDVLGQITFLSYKDIELATFMDLQVQGNP